jgi:hypothetical protein
LFVNLGVDNTQGDIVRYRSRDQARALRNIGQQPGRFFPKDSRVNSINQNLTALGVIEPQKEID